MSLAKWYEKSVRRRAIAFLFRIPPRDQRVDSDTQRFAECVHESNLVIDCGAHIGSVASKVLELGGVVHSFEPNSRNCAEIRKRVGNSSQFVLNEAAAGCSEEDITFFSQDENVLGSDRFDASGTTVSGKRNVQGQTVSTVRSVDLAQCIS